MAKIAKKKAAPAKKKVNAKLAVDNGGLAGIKLLESVTKKADALLKSIDSFKLKNPRIGGMPVLEKALKNVGKDAAKFSAAAKKSTAAVKKSVKK